MLNLVVEEVTAGEWRSPPMGCAIRCRRAPRSVHCCFCPRRAVPPTGERQAVVPRRHGEHPAVNLGGYIRYLEWCAPRRQSLHRRAVPWQLFLSVNINRSLGGNGHLMGKIGVIPPADDAAIGFASEDIISILTNHA